MGFDSRSLPSKASSRAILDWVAFCKRKSVGVEALVSRFDGSHPSLPLVHLSMDCTLRFTSTGSSWFDSHPCLPCQLCNTHWVAFCKRKSVELSWFVWYATLPFHLSIVNGLHFAFTSTGSSWFAAFPASCAIPTGMHLVSASLLSWAGLFDIPPFPSTCPLSMDCTLRSHLLDQVGSIHIPSFPASCAIPTGLHFVSASLLSWAGLFDIPPFPSTCPLSMD